MTDKAMTEEEKAKIALAKARDFKDGSPAPFLAQMEWEEHLIKEQQRLNREIMVEQHKLNKRIVIIAAIISALSAIFGGLIQKYGPDIRWWQREHTQPQTKIDKGISTKATTPLKELGETATTKENVSSKAPPVSIK